MVEIGRSDLGRITFSKGVVNTAFRWLPFFLPTLAIAFDASTATLALLLGIAEACGLTTAFVGRWLDAGHERRVIIISMMGIVVSSSLALVGSIWFFAAGVVVLGAASGQVTTAGHAWISARVHFDRRARFIGLFEVSWASALLVGVPLIAILISVFGWRGPFVAVALAAFVAAMLVGRIDDGERSADRRPAPEPKVKITPDAWLMIGASSMTALMGLTMIAIVGTWLDEVLGVSTGGIGLVAIAFGVAELIASTSSSAFADRLGKRRTMLFSVSSTLLGLAIIASAGTSLLVGAAGLFVFFVGFEYSIVTSFSLVSEAMPTARGQALAAGHALSTVSRGAGVAAAGVLYETFGVDGPIGLSVIGAVITLSLLMAVGRRRPDLA
ncbi:MAG: MFS transporter [Acidimicrobiales bacterium]|nr:MAG: MFS transporter [Acidimicrobiales bacterium]